MLFALYCLGLVVAPLVALLLKRTLAARRDAGLRHGDAAVQDAVAPADRPPLRRQRLDVRETGRTMILATMILVWALLYFPGGQDKRTDATKKTGRRKKRAAKTEERRSRDRMSEKADEAANELRSEWKGQSFLGRLGKSSSRPWSRWAGIGASAWPPWPASRPAR